MSFRHKALTVIVALLSILTLHSGRTDSNGGHWDYSTGEYHYHHGFPAHQHPNGVCPYDPNYSSSGSQAQYNPHSSGSSSRSIPSSSRSSSHTRTKEPVWREILTTIIFILLTPPYGWAIIYFSFIGIKKLVHVVLKKLREFHRRR